MEIKTYLKTTTKTILMKIFKYYLLLTLPLAYIMYLVYIRIFLTRAPRDLYVFSYPLLIITTTFIIGCLLLRIYFLLKSLKIIDKKPTKNKYILLLQQDIIILKAKMEIIVQNSFGFLGKQFKSYNTYLLNFIKFCYLHIPSKKHTVVILCMDIVSKIIVIMIFLLDVFYFKQLNYFYKTLWLLLLPLSLDIIKLATMQYYREHIVKMIALFDSKPIEATEFYEICFKENLKIFDYDDFEYYFYCEFCPVFEIPYNLAIRLDIRDKFRLKVINLIICIFYLIGWSYIWLIGMGYLSY